MQRFSNAPFYIGQMGCCSLLIYAIISSGKHLESGPLVVHDVEQSNWSESASILLHNLQHPLAILLAQIVTIFLAARLLG